jgi:hypothetical protein
MHATGARRIRDHMAVGFTAAYAVRLYVIFIPRISELNG